jgi:hypothetical protein
MAYRADTARPIAKIVLQADNHAQMHDTLLAIGRAVAHYDRPFKEFTRTA